MKPMTAEQFNAPKIGFYKFIERTPPTRLLKLFVGSCGNLKRKKPSKNT